MSPQRHISLAVALDGAGWHPAAWRSDDARPGDLLTAGYWSELVAEAERGLLDFVTIDDALTIQSADRFAGDRRVDQVRGRLDAVLIAARIAPTTSNIGVIPTITTAHTEPFHISKAIATLDFVSTGRAGVQVRVGGLGGEAALFGRRPGLDVTAQNVDDPDVRAILAERLDEAADYVEVVRRLWDSWQDDAEIRDTATGRFIDRDRLHYIDFEGPHFSVRGPSITPRPPQGQPIVAALAHSAVPYQLAARQADVVFVTPLDHAQEHAVLAEVRAVEASTTRSAPLQVFADLLVFLDDDVARAAARKDRLDELDGAEFISDARTFVGTSAGLAEEITRLHAAGYQGVRLRPGALPHDLSAITSRLVPELQRRGLYRDNYRATTLRGHLGLPRPGNRYEAA